MNRTTAGKTHWYNNTLLVILLCIFIFPVGLYALWKCDRLGKGVKTGLALFTVLFTVAVITGVRQDAGGATKKASVTETVEGQEVEKSKPFNWKIVNLDSSANQLTFRITINDRTNDRAKLIEVARRLKNERDWSEKVVCFFDIKVPSHTFAWASCAYLPQCPECATDKDEDGIPIEYNLIGMTPTMADSLRSLTMDSIAAKTVVASYLDDITRCKTILYRVEKEPNKLLMAQLFINGGKIVEWYPMKKVGGEGRYYVPESDEGNFFVINKGEKSINFYHPNGDCWWSVALEGL